MKVNGKQREAHVPFEAVKQGTVFIGPSGDVMLKVELIYTNKGREYNAVCLESGTVWTFVGDVRVKVFPSARVELYEEE